MPMFGSRRTAFLLCLWMSLATIVGHAVIPHGSPVDRSRGSAFSFATSDVAIGAKRRAPAGKSKRAFGTSPEERQIAPGGAPGAAIVVRSSPGPIARTSVRAPSHESEDRLDSESRAIGYRSRAPPLA